MQNNDLDDWHMTVKEAARYLGFAVGTVYNKISRDEIPHVRIGARGVRLRKSELDRWIIEQAAAADRVVEGAQLAVLATLHQRRRFGKGREEA